MKLNEITSLVPKHAAHSALDAYNYAVSIGHRFPAGESLIAKNAGLAYMYALNVINGRFLQGEDVIALKANVAIDYATDIIKGPFPKGEPAILASRLADAYKEFVTCRQT